MSVQPQSLLLSVHLVSLVVDRSVVLLLVEEVGLVRREVTDFEARMLAQLHGRIIERGSANARRDRFVRGRELLKSMGITVPSEMMGFQIPLDWPRKTVEVFSSRQIPSGYSTRETTSLIDDVERVLEDSHGQFLERQAIKSADMLGCSFVFTSRGDTTVGEPEVVVSVRSALAASAEMDLRTRRVTAALELTGGTGANLYLPGRVLSCVRTAKGWMVEDEYSTGSNRVWCAVYTHDASLEKPFGSSRITPTVMAATFAATRTLLRQEVASEFYSAPRSLLLGADSSVFDAPSAWSAVTGAVWGLPDVSLDDDQDMPDPLRRADLKQIPQMSMQPFSDQYRLLASVIAGASAIPVHYLGVTQDSNPTSAQALEAVENDLVRSVRAQESSFNMGRRDLALNIISVLHGDLDAERYSELRGLMPRWDDPRTRSMSEQSQMVQLQVQAGNMQPGTEATLSHLPISREEVLAHVQENKRAAGSSVLDRVLAVNGGANGDTSAGGEIRPGEPEARV